MNRISFLNRGYAFKGLLAVIPLKNSDPGSRAFGHLLLKSVFSHKHFEDNISAKLASVHCFSLCFGVFIKTLSHRRNILKYLTILTVYDLAIVID